MRLRKLELRDAPLMLEWMHDPSAVQYMNADFASKKVGDCEAFIQSAKDTTRDLHMAIVDENDTYMGTVSLKNIDGKTAEFAITVRKDAMGKGFSKYGMSEIIRVGFEELGLEKVYWCVNPENKRAVRFYDKNGYDRVPAASLKIGGGTAENKYQALSGTRYPEKKLCSPGSRLQKKEAHSDILFTILYGLVSPPENYVCQNKV